MTLRKISSPANYYYLCSYVVRSGELEATLYERPRQLMEPLTLRDYVREHRRFCEPDESQRITEAWLDQQELTDFLHVDLWPYDDRVYSDMQVQELTAAEYRVLERFIHY